MGTVTLELILALLLFRRVVRSPVAVFVLGVGLAAEEADGYAGEERVRGGRRGREPIEREAPGCRGGDLCAA